MAEYHILPERLKIDRISSSILKKLISRGEYLKAYDLCDEYTRNIEKADPEIVKQHALCMSKLGMIEKAIEMLQDLKEEGDTQDTELPALLGSLYKRKWLELNESNPKNAKKALVSSFENYMKARELGGDFWCNVNAAALALVLGKRDLSIELADEVITQCWDEYNKHGTTSEFWIPASMGEAYLIKGDYQAAARWYKGARSHVGSRIGQIKTTRTNAKMLLNLLETDDETADEILGCIRKPRIAIFAGHRIDKPGRARPRFPEHISNRMKNRLKKKLIEMKLDIGIASAADGADILFHECMHEMGKHTHIILPSPIEHFRKKLIEDSGENWVNRFDRIIEKADRIEMSSASRFDSDSIAAHQLSSDYMLEYSLDMTEAFGGELIPVVIWDQRQVKLAGGTGYIISTLRKLEYEPVGIPITDLVKFGRYSDNPTNEEYPYSKMGIYEPVIRPIIIISPYCAGIMEEEKASSINSIMEKISKVCEKESLRILSTGLLSIRAHLIMNSVSDVMDLIFGLRDITPPLPEHSLVLHAGLVTMLNSSVGGRRDYYCREIEEALEIASSLKIPTRIVTMQFKSIVSRTEYPEIIFRYSGQFRSKNGNHLKLFQLNC